MCSAVMKNVLNVLSLKISGLFLVYLNYFGIEAIVCAVRNWKNCANRSKYIVQGFIFSFIEYLKI
jgi:hypothetical protein